MASYDILMICVLAGAVLWGAFKGAAWQAASLGAIVASYFASYHLSDDLTSSGLFGQTAPWNRFAAMLTIYIITGIIIWMAFRVVSQTIEKIKLKDFDRQLGALFGLIKGVIFCVLITFFAVTLMPAKRDEIINTRSGRYVAKLLSKADAIVPPELQPMLEPYIKRFEESMQPSNVVGTDSAAPNSQPANANSPAPNTGNEFGNGNVPSNPAEVLSTLSNALNGLNNVPNNVPNNQSNGPNLPSNAPNIPSNVLNDLNNALNSLPADLNNAPSTPIPNP